LPSEEIDKYLRENTLNFY